jgi:ubiquinone biosynthesis protein UbiJ
MALTKETVVDKIEVLEMGQVQVRTATRIMENGTQLSQSFHRHVLAPADDLTNEDAKVVAIANATWTTDVVSAYEAMIANQIKEII